MFSYVSTWMGDRLVQTFLSVGMVLQVPFAGNCKLNTLLHKRKLCTKHRGYNELSLLLLERQITLHLLWRSYVGIKTGGKNGLSLQVIWE